MKHTILALDLGTNYGFSYDGLVGYTKALPKDDTKFRVFMLDLETFIGIGIRTIVYEAAAFQPGAAIPIYHGLVGVLKATSLGNGVRVIPIAVGTIKKCFTNDGRADKIKVMARCDELGYNYTDHNSADALAVHYSYRKLYGN